MKKILFYLGFIIPLISLGQQNTWEHSYGYNWIFESCNSVCKGYDKGVNIACNYNYKYTWILKTDANGVMLWDKYFLDYKFVTGSNHVDYEGNTYLTGCSTQYDPEWYDLFIYKLDACGNKVWCKTVHYEGHNYGNHIKGSSNGGVVMQTAYANDDWANNHKCSQLWEINGDGEVLWKKELINTEWLPEIRESFFNGMVPTTDGGFLLSGYCYMQPSGSIYKYLRGFVAKADANGEVEWYNVGFNNNMPSEAFAGIEHNNNYYCTGYYYTDPNNTSKVDPFLLKISPQGQTLFNQSVFAGDTLIYMPKGIEITANDHFIICGNSAHTMNELNFSTYMLTDTLGNLLKLRQNHNGNPDGDPMYKTYDNKFHIAGWSPVTANPNESNAYLTKFNGNLDWDTLYNQSFVYDSLCPQPIQSNNMDCNCDTLTVGLAEKPGTVPSTFNIYPNPASAIISITANDEVQALSLLCATNGMVLQTIAKPSLNAIDVSKLPNGVYLIKVWFTNQSFVARKLIIIK